MSNLEGLNNSLAQSSAEIFPCKNTCTLLDLSLSSPEDKVLIITSATKSQ